jgi:hypothetical protein
VTLDVVDGSVEVAAGTPGGAQTLRYRMCERANVDNCDQATATVEVAPQAILVSGDRLTVKEGGAGSFSVRLAQQPAGAVVVSAAFLEGTATVQPSPATLTFDATTWNTPATVRFGAAQDGDRNDNAATIQLTAVSVTIKPVVIRIVDDDRPATSPTATIEAPLNGQTVSGTVDFSGTATDIDGYTVEGKFSVDGNRIYTDKRTATSYRIPTRWNTATVATGWHTLELRVKDNLGDDGAMTIRVFVTR